MPGDGSSPRTGAESNFTTGTNIAKTDFLVTASATSSKLKFCAVHIEEKRNKLLYTPISASNNHQRPVVSNIRMVAHINKPKEMRLEEIALPKFCIKIYVISITFSISLNRELSLDFTPRLLRLLKEFLLNIICMVCIH